MNHQPKKMGLLTLLVLFIASALPNPHREPFDIWKLKYIGFIDEGALAACWVYAGEIAEMRPGIAEFGHRCALEVGLETEDDVQALDFCKSRFPYPIIKYKSFKATGTVKTECTFQVTMRCRTGYWQIHGKCYKANRGKYTFDEAKKMCSKEGQGVAEELNPMIVDYFSENLRVNFKDMVNINAAWVTVPNIKDYFSDGEGEVAVYLQEGSHIYHLKTGSIMLPKKGHKFSAFCQYDAPLTKAEIFRRVAEYSAIYPLTLTDNGAILTSSSFYTIDQIKLVQLNGNRMAEKFSTENLNNPCKGLGQILGIESYPVTGVLEEFDEIKESLTDHNFYLTSAYKDDGCSIKDFKSRNIDGSNFPLYTQSLTEPSSRTDYCHSHSFVWNKNNRFPAKAATRAPVICSLQTSEYKFGDCPEAPSWANGTVRFDRGNAVVCHYVNNIRGMTYEDAVESCKAEGLNGALSGFDSIQEFSAVREKCTDAYFNGHPAHFWLGGRKPCSVACQPGYLASWDEGVASNTTFLNEYKSPGGKYNAFWQAGSGDHLTFRQDVAEFHAHYQHDYGGLFYPICMRYALLVRSNSAKPN